MFEWHWQLLEYKTFEIYAYHYLGGRRGSWEEFKKGSQIMF